jgi:hypothetical protein
MALTPTAMNAAAVALGVRRLLTLGDVERAAAWGFNCGPAAICAVTGLTPEEVRPHLGDFEAKAYTNPTLMFTSLARLGLKFTHKANRGYPNEWPTFGLARIQWGGPWAKPGVPMAARYRQTHWVASSRTDTLHMVFDVNALSVNGGWIPFEMWRDSLVPWLLKEAVPRADGTWWLTHSIEVEPRS